MFQQIFDQFDEMMEDDKSRLKDETSSRRGNELLSISGRDNSDGDDYSSQVES